MLTNRLRNEVEATAKQCAVVFDMATSEHSESVREQTCRKYAHGHESWLWEHFDECVVFVDEHHWKTVGTCVGHREIFLFFDGDEDRAMFAFRSGEDLAKVLEQSFRFEYYVTDESSNFLIAVNHHNIIHALGDIEAELQKIKYG